MSAEATSDGRIITSVSLDCGAYCTGTCLTQKENTLNQILADNSQTFIINDYPETSNRSLSMYQEMKLFSMNIILYHL